MPISSYCFCGHQTSRACTISKEQAEGHRIQIQALPLHKSAAPRRNRMLRLSLMLQSRWFYSIIRSKMERNNKGEEKKEAEILPYLLSQAKAPEGTIGLFSSLPVLL